MKKYRVYEAYVNLVGGVEGVGFGWRYIKAESAKEAAEKYADELGDTELIVATDDDGDSYHLYK